jgi:hypothetical protein
MTPGIDPGEDIDYHNMVAAVKVQMASAGERFGPNGRTGPPPVRPTDPDCETRFRFDGLGRINGVDEDATETIRLLGLDHATLDGWRRSALDAWIPVPGEVPDSDPVSLSDQELRDLLVRLNSPQDGQLVEFSFVIRSYMRSLLPAVTE